MSLMGGKKPTKTQQPLPLCNCLIYSVPRNKYWNLRTFPVVYSIVIRKILTNTVKWIKIVPLQILEHCQSSFHTKSKRPNLSNLLCPTLQLHDKPAVPLYSISLWMAHSLSQWHWPLRDILDSFLPLTPHIQLLSGSGLSSFCSSLPWVCHFY